MAKHTCKICEREVSTRGLTLHLRSHSVEFRTEYLPEHLDEFPRFARCDVCGSITKIQGDKFVTCSRKCNAEYKSQNWQGEDAPWHGRRHTEETKRRISDTKKRQLADPENHPMYGKSHTEETKRKISEAHLELYRNGYENPMKGKTHTPEAIRKIFNSWSDSSREREMKEALDEAGIGYTHQFFLNDGGSIRSYDFKIDGSRILVEIDGDYWHGGPGCEKHFVGVSDIIRSDREKDALAAENGYTLLRFWGSEVKADPDSVAGQIAASVDKH